MLIGITGQSGCGKTTVSDIFEKNGYFIIDCDRIAHELMASNKDMLKELEETFGSEIFENGVLQRKELGKIVFNNPERLQMLNSITHKYILKRVKELLDNKEKAVIDAPLLIEAQLDKICDKCIYVYCPEEIRIKRIIERDGITEEYAFSRIKAQPNDDFYRKNCTHVVVNDGHTDLYKQLKELFD